MSSPPNRSPSPQRSRLPVRSTYTTLTPTSIPRVQSSSPEHKRAAPGSRRRTEAEGASMPATILPPPDPLPSNTPDPTDSPPKFGRPATPSRAPGSRSPSPNPDHAALVSRSPPKFSRPARPVRAPRSASPEPDPFTPTAQPWLQHNSPSLLSPAAARRSHATIADRSKSPPKLRRPLTPTPGVSEPPGHSRHSHCHSLVEASQPESRKLATTQLISQPRSPSPEKEQQRAADREKLTSTPTGQSAASEQSSTLFEQSGAAEQPDCASQDQPADGDQLAKPKHHILSLPQEVQDIIFGYAYPRNKSIKHVSPEQWTGREREERAKSDDYAVRQFPKTKVNDFLVSKSYILLAAKAYVAKQTFSEGYDFLHKPYRDISDVVNQHVGIVWEFLVRIKVKDLECSKLKEFHNLKHVAVEFTDMAFIDLEPALCAQEHLLVAEDLKQTSIYTDLMACRKLQTVEAVIRNGPGLRAPHRAATMRKNVATFENTVNSELLLRDRAEEDKWYGTSCNGQVDRLYRGSRVCVRSSQLASSLWDTYHLSIPEILRSSAVTESDRSVKQAVDTSETLCNVTFKRDATESEHGWTKEHLPEEAFTDFVNDCDIPETTHDLERLQALNPAALVEWIQYAKDVTCSRPLHGQPYVTDRLKLAKAAFNSAKTKQGSEEMTQLVKDDSKAERPLSGDGEDSDERILNALMPQKRNHPAVVSVATQTGLDAPFFNANRAAEEDSSIDLSALEWYGELMLMLSMLGLFLVVGWLVMAQN